MHVLLGHLHRLQAQSKGMQCRCQNNFIATLHLVSCNALCTLLISLRAVIKFVIFYAKGASYSDSDRHLKFVQSEYH